MSKYPICDHVRKVKSNYELCNDKLHDFYVNDKTSEIFSFNKLEGISHSKMGEHPYSAIPGRLLVPYYDYNLNAPTYDEVLSAFSEEIKNCDNGFWLSEIKEYFEFDPENSESYLGSIILEKGMLRHNKNDPWTFSLGKGYLAYRLSDYSKYEKLKTRTEILCEDMKNEDKRLKESLHNKSYSINHPLYSSQSKVIRLDEPCAEYPIELYLAGTDDLSYKKFFRSYEEAKLEMFCYNNKESGFSLYSIISENNDFVNNN
jgi:hypothetical protein